MLTEKEVKKLCEELPLMSGHSVKVNSESKPDAQKQWALWAVYTEEGPITERLDSVDPNWEFKILDKWADGNAATVYAQLTVCGVSRDCVGSGTNTKPQEAQKGAATDALKRGARLFGIGRYLLDVTPIYTDWLPKKRGQEWVRTRQQEEKWKQEAFNKFATWYSAEFGGEQPQTTQSPPSELDEVIWTRNENGEINKFATWAIDEWVAMEVPTKSTSHAYNRLAQVLGLPDVAGKQAAFHVAMLKYTGSKQDAMAAVQGYVMKANEGSEGR
jgi:hypothetical protein